MLEFTEKKKKKQTHRHTHGHTKENKILEFVK